MIPPGMNLVSMNPVLDLKLLALIGVANGASVFAKTVLGERLAVPLDASARLGDGQPLLGRSKSVRGIVVSLLATSVAAPLLGISWLSGAIIAAAAMGGDLFSSFLKRRLKLEPSSMALGIDQLPESILPALACRFFYALSTPDIAAIGLTFFVLELAFSRLLYLMRLRDTPY